MDPSDYAALECTSLFHFALVAQALYQTDCLRFASVFRCDTHFLQRLLVRCLHG